MPDTSGSTPSLTNDTATSSTFFRQIIEASPTLIAGIDKNLRFVAHSRQYISLFHLDKESLIGLHVKEVFPNIEQSWLDDFERCLLGEKIGPKKISTGTGTGRKEELYRSLIPFIPDGKDVLGIVIVNEVITPRHKLEKDLRESELRYKTLAESTFEAIFVSENGIGIDTNRRATEMFGYSYDEIIGMFGTTVAAEQDREMVKEKMLSEYQEPYEMLARRKDGSTFQAKIRGKNIDYLAAGRKVRVTVVTDIDKETKAISALKESEKKYRDLIENINDAIYIIDPSGIMTYVSPVIEQILGYSPEELIGKSFLQFVHKDDRQFMISRFAEKKILSGLPSECRLIHIEGKSTWVRVSTKPSYQNGKLTELSGVLTDISREKQVEEERRILERQLQQARRMEAIGTLAGGIAHDLNNILSGIVSYPDLLLMGMSPEDPARAPLETIQRSGKLAAAIVQDMLTLSRQNIHQKEPEDINQLIHHYLASPEGKTLLANHPGVTVDFHPSSDLPRIHCSAPHMAKVFMNLITNGVESMESGGTLFLSSKITRQQSRVVCNGQMNAGEYLTITIKDQGSGIHQDDIDRIFEPFYSTKKLGRSGSGLGMAVVWRSIEEHNGFIDIQSAPDQGTQVELYLRVEEAVVTTSSEKKPLDFEQIRGNGERILLVDDVPEQLAIGTTILKNLGYTPVTAKCGEEAVEFIRSNTAACVVLDMIMDPGMDGLDTYRKILNINPLQKALIASGFAETERVKEGLKLGILGYIQKPYSVLEFGLALSAALNRR